MRPWEWRADTSLVTLTPQMLPGPVVPPCPHPASLYWKHQRDYCGFGRTFVIIWLFPSFFGQCTWLSFLAEVQCVVNEKSSNANLILVWYNATEMVVIIFLLFNCLRLFILKEPIGPCSDYKTSSESQTVSKLKQRERAQLLFWSECKYMQRRKIPILSGIISVLFTILFPWQKLKVPSVFPPAKGEQTKTS